MLSSAVWVSQQLVASRKGRLAGENMAGAKKHYQHQSFFWLQPDLVFKLMHSGVTWDQMLVTRPLASLILPLKLLVYGQRASHMFE